MWCGRKFCSTALTETNLPPLSLAFFFSFPLKVPQLFRKENKENLNRGRGKKMGSLGEKEKRNNERKQTEKQPQEKKEKERKRRTER